MCGFMIKWSASTPVGAVYAVFRHIITGMDLLICCLFLWEFGIVLPFTSQIAAHSHISKHAGKHTDTLMLYGENVPLCVCVCVCVCVCMCGCVCVHVCGRLGGGINHNLISMNSDVYVCVCMGGGVGRRSGGGRRYESQLH